MLHSVSKMTPMQLPPGYMTVPEVAAYLGVSRQTIWRWLRDLDFPSHQPSGPRGRRLFKRSEVDAWIDAGCSPRTAGERAS